LAIAWSVAFTHPVESSYCDPEQSPRKFGLGEMSAEGLPGGRMPRLTTGWAAGGEAVLDG